MKILLLFFIVLQFVSCHSFSQNSKTIRLEALVDSCYKIPESASRQFEIIENTFEDTVALGFAILLPKVTGWFRYLRLDESVDKAFDPDTPDWLLPATKMFCLTLHNNKKTKGHILIRYY